MQNEPYGSLIGPEPSEMVRPHAVAVRAYLILIFALFAYDTVYTWLPTNTGKGLALFAACAITYGLHYIGARNAIRKYEWRKQAASCSPVDGPAP